jgi:hypothetical protein
MAKARLIVYTTAPDPRLMIGSDAGPFTDPDGSASDAAPV